MRQSALPRVEPGVLFTGVQEPVAVSTLKLFLRVTGSAEDALLVSLISVARGIAERLTGRAIPKQTFVAWWDAIPTRWEKEWWDGTRDGAIGMDREGYVEIPNPPLISIEAVKAFQDDDTSTTFSVGNYFVDAKDQNLPGRLVLRLGSTWPVFIRPRNGFSVEYTAGYATVPADIAHAILLMASWLYKNRGDCSDDGCAGSCGAMSFLRNFVVMKVA